MLTGGQTLGELKAGDEVLIKGTIDCKAGPSIWLVVDGASIGRVVKVPVDVIAVKTGTSPNYERTLLTDEEKRKRRNALQQRYREERKAKRGEGSEPEHRS